MYVAYIVGAVERNGSKLRLIMEFSNNQAIYIQIAEFISDKIQSGELKDNEKIPSVRELAVELEVNPNTVMRAYEMLQQQDIVFTKRGMGFFVQVHSSDKIKSVRKQHFLKEELPEFFKKIKLLGIDFKEIETYYLNTINSESGN